MRVLIVAAALAAGLSACASTGERARPDTTADLAERCRERGGVLVPSGRPSTGRPETDNVCQINGASRIR